ncbi:MAG TPA: PVC-type heme-binding CxxCH protein [Gemmataceae bacterium]
MHRSARRRFLFLLCGLPVTTLFLAAVSSGQPYDPPVAPASDEAARAIPGFRLAEGLEAELWAAEPLLANPVAFAFDEKGRCYVAETFRLHAGVTDNRGHMYWLDDELASRTVADRVAMYRKYHKEKFADYEREHDRVRRVWDSDGDGRADRATVFADGFKDAAAGIGSGVLARGRDVWYTCIPDLWLLRDADADGKADEKKSLSSGYGVHVAFIGHDLHGLTMGPDGRLYFSIGDRGLNVVTREGKRLFNPDSGAVLRCEPDGSNLEIVVYGLRNPQELAFDAYGRLFTGDNNSDSGDRARWVHVVEGGDSGWRIGYQYGSAMSNRGPWNAEKIWHLAHEGQPAYVLPPLAHITDGPSGLVAYPGVGLGDRYKDHFFLCDFRGAPGTSGVWALTVKPKGAAFEVADLHRFVWNILATDCDFGPDGAFYVSDWVEGWGKTGKGRVYRFTDPGQMKKPVVQEVRKLLAEGFDKRPDEELRKLLEHADRRVRQEAQFALAERPDTGIGIFTDAALTSKNVFARLHSVWGLGQIARHAGDAQTKARALAPGEALVKDPDPEVRIQAAGHLSDAKFGATPRHLIPLLRDPEPRVRLHAAIALGRHVRPDDEVAGDAYAAVRRMLEENADRDPYLRHGGVMALTGLGEKWAAKAAQDVSPAVRMGAVLAMRRLGDAAVARLLSDAEPRLVEEAARAIHDEPIPEALPQLAALITRSGLSEPLGYRVLNANYRLGGPENALALARFAARAGEKESLRAEALRMLGDWANPPRRDRVTGGTQSLPPRPAEVAAAALRPALGGIAAGPRAVRRQAARVAGKLGIKEIGGELFELVSDAGEPADVRVQALEALESLKDERLAKAVEAAIASADPLLRNAGRAALAKTAPDKVVGQLAEVVGKPDSPLRERQGAYELLGSIGTAAADELLANALDRLLANDLPPELHLEVLEAARRRAEKSAAVREKLAAYEKSLPEDDPLAAFREALAGGDAKAGREIFLNKSETYCLRCHKVDGDGGEVGPDLSDIGAKQPRPYLLEAIVLPDKQIAKGYESVLVYRLDGKIVRGVLRSEDAKRLNLITPEGQLVTVAKEDIDVRQADKSAMPEDLVKHLSKRELRDLVEFLSVLKGRK